MLVKVISGGQTGADIAGLRAAKAVGLETGGLMPRQWLTEEGYKPEYRQEFGLEDIPEGGMKGYKFRTIANAQDADNTIIFSTNWKSPGTVLTLEAASRKSKNFFCIDPSNSDWEISQELVSEVVDWIKKEDIKILNVAGNRKSKSPRIEKFVEEFMLNVFVGLGID